MKIKVKETTPETEEKFEKIYQIWKKEPGGVNFESVELLNGRYKDFIRQTRLEAYEQGKKEVINGIATKYILTKEIRKEVVEEILEKLENVSTKDKYIINENGKKGLLKDIIFLEDIKEIIKNI